MVQRKNSGSGFVAIDSVEFKFFEDCLFAPDQAKPIPTTIPPTTVPTTTTVEPTEPPDCTYIILFIHYRKTNLKTIYYTELIFSKFN